MLNFVEPIRFSYKEIFKNFFFSKRKIEGFNGIINLKTTNLQPLSFNNTLAICYYSEDDLPKGIKSIEEIKNKYVTYMFIFKKNGGMVYHGSTKNFTMRLNSHDKDALTLDKELYALMREEPYFVVKILGVYDNEEDARKSEEKNILAYRKIIGKIICHQNIDNFKESEIREIVKPYTCNISKTTKHG